MKKTHYYVLSFWLVIQILVIPAIAYETETSGISIAKFIMSGSVENGLKGYVAEETEVIQEEIEGKQAWILSAAGENEDNKTIYFSLLDNEMKAMIADGYGLEIAVEYMDEGTGFFAFVYDSIFDELEETVYDWNIVKTSKYTDNPGEYGGYVQLENTGVWKTHTFYVRDPKFQNGLENGADFYFSLNHIYSGEATEDVAIASVEVKTMNSKSPARVQSYSSEVGNNFFSDSKVSFNTEIISVVDYDFQGQVVFSALDIYDVGYMYDKTIEPMRLERDGTLDKKYILEQKTETITLKAGETLKKNVQFDVEKYGLMTYRVELIDDDNSIYTVYDKAFSRVPRKSDEPLNQDLGVSMHYMVETAENDAWVDTGFEMLKRIGAGWIRGDLRWRYLEKTRGVYDLIDGHKNFLMRNQEKYGGKFNVLAIMNFESAELGITPTDYADSADKRQIYGEFTKKAVETLGEYGVDVYEFGNEPNIKDISGAAYAEMTKTGYDMIKESFPNAMLAGPVTADVPTSPYTNQTVNSKNVYFIPEYFAADGIDSIDLVTVHPYRKFWAPEESDGSMDKLRELRELCADYGKEDIEIWATEMGYPTFPGNEQILLVGDDSGDLGQAAWTVRFYIMALAENVLDKFFIYTLNDGEDRFLNRYGMSRGYTSPYEAFTAKPALVAVSNMSRILDGAEGKEKLVIGDKEIFAYRLSRPNKDDVIALWTTDGDKRLKLSLGTKQVKLYDMYGNESTISSLNGVYELTLNQTVVYVEGNFTDFKSVDEKFSNLTFDEQVDSVYILNSGWDISSCATDTQVKSGRVYISLDWKQDTATQSGRVGLLHSKKIGNEYQNLLFGVAATDGSTMKMKYHKTNAATFAGDSDIFNFTAGEWNHLDILLNFNDKSITYYLNGSYLGTASMNDRIAKDGFYGLAMAGHQVVDNVVIKQVDSITADRTLIAGGGSITLTTGSATDVSRLKCSAEGINFTKVDDTHYTVFLPDNDAEYTFSGTASDGTILNPCTVSVIYGCSAADREEPYVVEFKTNGGDKVYNQRVKAGETIKVPTVPTKHGFTFAGWYTEESLTTEYDFVSEVTKDITLYAKWLKNDVGEVVPTKPRYFEDFSENTMTDGALKITGAYEALVNVFGNESPVKTGQFYIGMDVKYPELSINRWMSLVSSGTVGTGRVNTSMLVGGTQGNIGFSLSNVTASYNTYKGAFKPDADKWYHIDMLLDFERRRILYYKDGLFWGEGIMNNRVLNDGVTGLFFAASSGGYWYLDNLIMTEANTMIIPRITEYGTEERYIELDFGMPIGCAEAEAMLPSNVSVGASAESSSGTDIPIVTAVAPVYSRTGCAQVWRIKYDGHFVDNREYYLEVPDNFSGIFTGSISDNKVYFSIGSETDAVKYVGVMKSDDSTAIDLETDEDTVLYAAMYKSDGALENISQFNLEKGTSNLTMNFVPNRIYIWNTELTPMRPVFDVAD